MTKWLAFLILFIVLSVVQTSFFASLPGFLAYTPLVGAAGVYLVQHAGLRSGALLVGMFGLFLDLLAIPSFPFETLSYVAAGAVAYLSAQHLFSNRSWYGLAACGLLAVTSMSAVRAAVLGWVSLQHPERVSWATFADTLLWNAVLMVALLTVFFTFAGQIRSVLKRTFIVPSERDTL